MKINEQRVVEAVAVAVVVVGLMIRVLWLLLVHLRRLEVFVLLVGLRRLDLEEVEVVMARLRRLLVVKFQMPLWQIFARHSEMN